MEVFRRLHGDAFDLGFFPGGPLVCPPLCVFAMKGKLDHAIELLEAVERRLGTMEKRLPSPDLVTEEYASQEPSLIPRLPDRLHHLSGSNLALVIPDHVPGPLYVSPCLCYAIQLFQRQLHCRRAGRTDHAGDRDGCFMQFFLTLTGAGRGAEHISLSPSIATVIPLIGTLRLFATAFS